MNIKEQIKAEIERLKKEQLKNNNGVATGAGIYIDADRILSFIDSLPEEQNEDLEKKEQDDIIGKAMSYFGAESLLDNANGLTDFEKFTAWLYCEFLRGLPKKLNQDYIKEQSKVILGAIKKELGRMPDSTELIAQWDAEREMLEQKNFRGDEWRLAQNAFFDGFGHGYLVHKEQMLKDAVEGFIFQSETYYPKELIAHYKGDLQMGDMVKVIVVEEDAK